MNNDIKYELKIIFAKEIGKQLSDLNSNDFELFEDWISFGLAAEHIKNIKNDLKTRNIKNDLETKKVICYTSDKKCRNCDNLVIEIRHAKAFGVWPTLRLYVYCSYWHNKNKTYKNTFYNINLDDMSCTQFISHRNVFDIHNIDISDIEYFSINNDDFSSLPVASLVDKGYNLKKIDKNFFFVRG